MENKKGMAKVGVDTIKKDASFIIQEIKGKVFQLQNEELTNENAKELRKIKDDLSKIVVEHFSKNDDDEDQLVYY